MSGGPGLARNRFAPPAGSTGGGSGGVQVDKDGSTIVPVATILNFVGAGVSVAPGGPGEAVIQIVGSSGGGLDTVFHQTLDAGMIAAKSFTLPVVPADANKVLVDLLDGSPALQKGVHFDIVGTTFTWNGFLLDGLLAVGNVFRLAYGTAVGSGLPGFTFVADAAARNALTPASDGFPVVQLDNLSIWLWDLGNSAWRQSGYGTVGNSEMREVEGYLRVKSPAPGLDPAGNQSLDWAVRGYREKTGGNATITFQNMVEGQMVYLVMVGPGAPYALTFAGETFRWEDGAAPIPTATAGRRDLYAFQKINGIVYGGCIQNMF